MHSGATAAQAALGGAWRMKHLFIALICVLVVCLQAQASEKPSATLHLASELANSSIQSQLDQVIREFAANNATIPGVAVFVDQHRHHFTWAGAVGFADPQNKTPLTAEHPIRIASVTKTFVAAAVLRLVEQRRMHLDRSVDHYLSTDSLTTLRKGNYRTARMTVRHLLTHRAGLVDYYENQTFMQLAAENPQRRWTRAEQLTYAVEAGQPLFAPGAGYHYSDTGYILLGEIMERRTGTSLGAALRQLIGYSRLNMHSTWHESIEPEPRALLPRAHQFEGKRDIYNIDPSIDLYGGGGLVSTVGDMARFMQGLFGGKVFTRPETLEIMVSAPKGEKTSHYRMGIAVKEIAGIKVYLHNGYWGTSAAFAPSLNLAIGISVGQHEAQTDPLLESVIKVFQGGVNTRN